MSAKMEFQSTPLEGLVVIRPERHLDARGSFMETFRKDLFDAVTGAVEFVQDNQSESTLDVLRGLHMQCGEDAQAKLVRVVSGRVFDVAVDFRPDSPTFGKWFGLELSDQNNLIIYIPRGFAHGFLVLSDKATFVYKTDNYYAPASEVTVAYDDPEIGIKWPEPSSGYILSEKDRRNAISVTELKQKLSDAVKNC